MPPDGQSNPPPRRKNLPPMPAMFQLHAPILRSPPAPAPAPVPSNGDGATAKKSGDEATASTSLAEAFEPPKPKQQQNVPAAAAAAKKTSKDQSEVVEKESSPSPANAKGDNMNGHESDKDSITGEINGTNSTAVTDKISTSTDKKDSPKELKQKADTDSKPKEGTAESSTANVIDNPPPVASSATAKKDTSYYYQYSSSDSDSSSDDDEPTFQFPKTAIKRPRNSASAEAYAKRMAEKEAAEKRLSELSNDGSSNNEGKDNEKKQVKRNLRSKKRSSGHVRMKHTPRVPIDLPDEMTMKTSQKQQKQQQQSFKQKKRRSSAGTNNEEVVEVRKKSSSSAKTKKVAGNAKSLSSFSPTKQPAILPAGTTTAPCPEIGIGWIVQSKPRKVTNKSSGKHIDRYYFSPKGERFRSMAEVDRYLASLNSEVVEDSDEPAGTTTAPCPIIGTGWIVQSKPRKVTNKSSGKHFDRYYFSPKGERFRSMAEVDRYLASLNSEVVEDADDDDHDVVEQKRSSRSSERRRASRNTSPVKKKSTPVSTDTGSSKRATRRSMRGAKIDQDEEGPSSLKPPPEELILAESRALARSARASRRSAAADQLKPPPEELLAAASLSVGDKDSDSKAPATVEQDQEDSPRQRRRSKRDRSPIKKKQQEQPPSPPPAVESSSTNADGKAKEKVDTSKAVAEKSGPPEATKEVSDKSSKHSDVAAESEEAVEANAVPSAKVSTTSSSKDNPRAGEEKEPVQLKSATKPEGKESLASTPLDGATSAAISATKVVPVPEISNNDLEMEEKAAKNSPTKPSPTASAARRRPARKSEVEALMDGSSEPTRRRSMRKRDPSLVAEELMYGMEDARRSKRARRESLEAKEIKFNQAVAVAMSDAGTQKAAASKKKKRSRSTMEHKTILEIGDRVEAKYHGRGKMYFPGTIVGISPDEDRFDIDYDDGDRDHGLSGFFVRYLPTEFDTGDLVDVDVSDEEEEEASESEEEIEIKKPAAKRRGRSGSRKCPPLAAPSSSEEEEEEEEEEAEEEEVEIRKPAAKKRGRSGAPKPPTRVSKRAIPSSEEEEDNDDDDQDNVSNEDEDYNSDDAIEDRKRRSPAKKKSGKGRKVPQWLKDKSAATFSERITMLKAFKAKYGTCDITPYKHEVDPLLKSFVMESRKQYKKYRRGEHSTLTDERVAILTKMGFDFTPLESGGTRVNHNRRFQAQWDVQFAELQKYKAEFGDCLVSCMTGDHKKLGNWVRGQRKLMNKKGRKGFEPSRLARLEEIGFDFQPVKSGSYLAKKRQSMFPRVDANWNKHYQNLLQYKKEHGNIQVGPKTEDCAKGLYDWIHAQRKEYKKWQAGDEKALMYQKWVDKLNALDFNWAPMKSEAFIKLLTERQSEKFDNLWSKHYSELQKFKQKHGHCYVSRTTSGNDDNITTLASWIHVQRKHKRKLDEGKRTPLTEERIRLLNEIGLDWNPSKSGGMQKKLQADRDIDWEATFCKLCTYKRRHGHANPKKAEPLLGSWAYRMRKMYEQKMNGETTTLSDEKVAKLKSIGFQFQCIKSASV